MTRPGKTGPKAGASPDSEPPIELTGTTTALLVAAGRLAQRRLEAVLASRRLTLRHVGALGHLADSPDLSYSELARRAHVTPQSMHATIGQLLELGAIRTEPRGRTTHARLTKKGTELLAFASRAAVTCDDQLGFSPAALGAVRVELTALVQRLLAADV